MRKLLLVLTLSFFCTFATAQKRLPTPKENTKATAAEKEKKKEEAEQKKVIPVGRRVTIILKGVSGTAEKNIKAILQVTKGGWLPTSFRRRTQVRLAAQSDKERVIKAVEPYGYFSPKVRHRVHKTPDGWSITYTIHLGRPVLYNALNLKITGAAFPPEAEKLLKKNWPIKPGQTFSVSSYNKAKTLLISLANDYGFFSYRMVSAKTKINRYQYTADVTIVFFLGKRYRFGKTTFNHTRLNNSFLHRFLLYRNNEPYLAKKFDATRSGFIDSRYFSSVNMVPTPNKKTGKTNIKTMLKQLPPRSYTVGAGYGTDTGPRGLFSATFNDLDPHGDKLNVLLRGSQVNNAALVSFIIPGHYPPKDKYALTAGISNLDEIPGKSFSRKIGGSYLTQLGHWTLTAQINSLKESYNFTNLPQTKTNLFYPQLSARYVITDNLLFPKNGFSFASVVSGASNKILSKTSFSQYNIDLRFVHTFWNRLRMLLRTNIAYTDVKNIEEIPLSLQLMAGGVNSIRGYSFNAIYNGKELFTGSFEMQVRLFGGWYLAGFYDAGNVTNDLFKEPLNVGTGPAIMWASPMGAIEVSAARTVSGEKKVWRIQVAMGTFL